MWRVLEIGEKIEYGDERYRPKDMAWSTVTESCIGLPVVRADHVLRRKISDNAELEKPTHNSESTPHGRFSGPTVSCTAHDFEQACRTWYRAYMKAASAALSE